jgi:hypothetical protein
MELLPGDISKVDCESLNRATARGLIPMEGGWIAGGYVAQLALRRIRGEVQDQKPHGKHRPEKGGREECALLDNVDPETSARALLQIRTDLVRRRVIT